MHRVARSQRRVIFLTAAAMLGAALLAGDAAHAGGVYVVTKEADTADGTCNADCSLREAIRAANDHAGADTVMVPAGNYVLTNASGDLDITDDLTIDGAGPAVVTVDGSGLASPARVFDVDTDVTAVLDGLEVRGGHATGSSPDGGGIRNRGELTLVIVYVTDNEADGVGGGIYNQGTLVANTLFATDNKSDGDGGGIYNDGEAALAFGDVAGNDSGEDGGGIYNELANPLTLGSVDLTGNSADGSGGGLYTELQATVSLSGGSVEGNTAGDDGGGIYVEGNTTVTIDGGEVADNHAVSAGGGVYNAGNLQVADTSIDGNSGGLGGGISNGGSVTISGSTISDNTSSLFGGGLWNMWGAVAALADSLVTENSTSSDGGGINNLGDLALVASTVSGNAAANGGGVYGEGLGTATVAVNSTISGNEARFSGGGVYSQHSDVLLYSVTIAANAADSDDNGTGDGGGIVATPGTWVWLRNTLIGDNRDPLGSFNCHGTFQSEGYNLVESVSGFCNIVGDTTGNITGQDPLLEPLAYNGGTPSHALLAGSPAIDAGDPAGCTDNEGNPLPEDQRGFERRDGDFDGTVTCDIGAYEFWPEATPTPSPTPVPSPSATATPTRTPAGTPSPTPGPQNELWGDVQCDDDVDTVDALGDLRFVAALSPLGQTEPCPDVGTNVGVAEGEFPWGDADCDRDVDSVDTLKLLRYVAALPVAQTEPCPDVDTQVLVSDG